MGRSIQSVTVKKGESVNIPLNGRRGAFILSIAASEQNLFGTSASSRTDYGAPADLRLPSGYHERIARLWRYYDVDPMFGYLIDRMIQFAANGTSWHVKNESEQFIWDMWARQINKGINGTIPGLDEIGAWNYKNLLITGMAVNNWQNGKLKINKGSYNVPINWLVHNSRSIVLERPNVVFESEKIGLKLNKADYEKIAEQKEGLNKATSTSKIGEDKVLLLDSNVSFALKYNYCPGDNTRSDTTPKADVVAQSLYPTPPFFRLLPVLAQREQFRSLEVTVADGFIHKLVIWKIGDKENPPRPEIKNKDGTVIQKSTTAQVKDLITVDNAGTKMQLFVPYYVNLEIKTPDIQPMVSQDKWIQSTREMLWAFGILTVQGGDTRIFEVTNVKNFESFIDYLRLKHFRRFVEGVIATQIVENNKLSGLPNLVFKPLNTSTEEFKRSLIEMMKVGKISDRTLFEVHRLNADVEDARIRQELEQEDNADEGTSRRDRTNDNVPLSFVQRFQDNNGDGESANSANNRGGRPRGSKDTKIREDE